MKLNRVNSREPRSILKKDLETKNRDAYEYKITVLYGPLFSNKAEKTENLGRKQKCLLQEHKLVLVVESYQKHLISSNIA